jgi:hypothetical protein
VCSRAPPGSSASRAPLYLHRHNTRHVLAVDGAGAARSLRHIRASRSSRRWSRGGAFSLLPWLRHSLAAVPIVATPIAATLLLRSAHAKERHEPAPASLGAHGATDAAAAIPRRNPEDASPLQPTAPLHRVSINGAAPPLRAASASAAELSAEDVRRDIEDLGWRACSVGSVISIRAGASPRPSPPSPRRAPPRSQSLP